MHTAMDTTDDCTTSSSTKTTSASAVADRLPSMKPPSPPRLYTLRQAFVKNCLRECQRNAKRASLEEDMLLPGLSNNDKQAIISHYEYTNNPLSSSDLPPPFNKYYLQYHVFDLVVFRKYATQAWNDVVQFFKDNKCLEKKYSKNMNYKLQMYRQCNDSLSPTIQLIIAYPRHSHKYEESCDHFLNNSGIKDQFPIWNVTACKSYSYLSPEEYIKLLNTHAGGCFVSELYPRFRISPPPSADRDDDDDDESITECDDASGTDTDGSTDDDDDSDDDNSGNTDAGDSTDDCEGDDMLSTIEDNDINDDADAGGNDNSCNAATAVRTSASSRRVFKMPHPDVGISSPQPPPNKKKKNKPSKLESLIAEMNNVEHRNNTATKPPHQQRQVARRRFYPSIARSRYFRATTFMKHSINCGGHKQDIVARDIHTGTNTLIFHARSYNIHHKNDVVRSRDYLLPYSPAVPSAGTATSTTATSNTKKQKKPTTT